MYKVDNNCNLFNSSNLHLRHEYQISSLWRSLSSRIWLYGITPQKIALFIVTTMGASNVIQSSLYETKCILLEKGMNSFRDGQFTSTYRSQFQISKSIFLLNCLSDTFTANEVKYANLQCVCQFLQFSLDSAQELLSLPFRTVQFFCP
jgi:hypothetical protein